MKKALKVLPISVFVAALLIGCKGKDAASGGDPKTVIIAFFERMSKKDIDGAAKFATKASKSTMDMVKKGMEMGEKMGEMKAKDGTEDFKNMQFGETKIDGDNATVEVTNPAKENQTIAFPLKKENGNWKVDFSMSTLMKMGMNEAGKKMKGFGDDDENSSDEIPSMDKFNKLLNSDSLKMGLDKLDSLMKTVDPEKMKELKDAMEKMKKMSDQ